MTKAKQKIRALFTNDAEVGDPSGVYVSVLFETACDVLNADPRNALVAETDSGKKIAIFRSASDEADSFYLQELPIYEPDADGGNLTASEALTDALSR